MITARIEHLFVASPTFSAGTMTVHETGARARFAGSCSVRVDEDVFLEGKWVDDPKWGRQFQVTGASPVSGEERDPFDEQAFVDYLSKNKDFKHVGPIRARKLVEVFGGVEGLSTALLERPREVVEAIPGLTDERVAYLAARWALDYFLHRYRVELMRSGLKDLEAKRVIQILGPHAATILQEHPYDLFLVAPELGFERVDQIAMKLGFARGSAPRAACRVVAAVHEANREGGHTVLSVRPSATAIVEDYSNEHRRFAEHVQVVGEDQVALTKHVEAEQRIEQMGLDLFEKNTFWREGRPRPQAPEMLNARQRLAFRALLEHRGLLLLGGAGTGKTFLANHIADAFENVHGVVEFCAPTGKASKRLSESTGRPAQTIHRLLGARGTGNTAMFSRTDRIEANLLVLDEISMCDSVLLGALLRFVDTSQTSLLLMGDPNQLPPVSPGNPLRDLVEHADIPHVTLEQVHRQGGELKIACCKILEGVCSRPIWDEGRPVWVPRVISKKGFGDDVLDILEEVDHAGYSPETDVQVLTPLRRTCTQLNELLQSYFAAWGVDVNEAGLRLGDKVIQTKNDYSLNVFNGEVGIVSATDPEATRVNYDGREVTYNHDARDLMGVRTFPHKHLELAYCLTVHKSQGSEYPVVIVVLPCESQLNHRNLLYTAVTRARERVYLLVENRALEQALETEIRDERITWLSTRAKGETP